MLHVTHDRCATGLAFVIAALFLSSIATAADSPGDDGTSKTVLAKLDYHSLLEGQWAAIAKKLRSDAASANDPVARLLMAHACLATNDPNAAHRLFMSCTLGSQLKMWGSWTSQLAAKHPLNGIALYLAADAQARLGNHRAAIEGFTIALRQRQTFALAQNARGVAYAMIGQWDEALVDFHSASKSDESFADAAASFSTLAAWRETSIGAGDLTLTRLGHALVNAPNFALAHNTLGCLYFGAGRFEEASNEFQLAEQLDPFLLAASENYGIAEIYLAQVQEIANKHSGTGVPISVRIEELRHDSQKQLDADSQVVPSDIVKALPHMSPESVQKTISTYGMGNILKAAQSQIRSNQIEALALNQQSQKKHQEVTVTGRLQQFLAFFKFGRTFTSAATNVNKIADREDWEPFIAPSKKWGSIWMQTGKSVAKEALDNRTVAVIIDGTLTANPASSALSSVTHIADDILADRAGSLAARHAQINQRTANIALETRNLTQFTTRFDPKTNLTNTSVTNRNPFQPQIPTPPSTGLAPRTDQTHSFSVPKQTARPGGVTTETIALALVDRGSWPVTVVFTLAYPPSPDLKDGMSTKRNVTNVPDPLSITKE